MKSITITILGLCCAMILSAQKFKVAAFGELAVPTYSEIKSVGYGGGIQADLPSHKKWRLVGTVAFNKFPADVIDHFNSDTIPGFSIMPVLLGVKYYPMGNFFVTAQAGATVGVENAGTCFTLSPGVGMELGSNEKKHILVGLNFTGVMKQTSYPENNFLNRGGYSFLSARIGYIF